MDKKDFAEQIRARKEEIAELEEMVQRYANRLHKSAVSSLLKGNMITAYRIGVIDTLDHLDQKAQEIAIKRSIKQDFLTTSKG
jgi:hypothetical protein